MPVNRRTFLKLASIYGMSFSSNAVFASNFSRTQTTQHRDRIDVHHHILPPVYTSTLAKIGISGAGGVPFPNWNAQRSLDVMDRNGIATAIARIGIGERADNV